MPEQAPETLDKAENPDPSIAEWAKEKTGILADLAKERQRAADLKAEVDRQATELSPAKARLAALEKKESDRIAKVSELNKVLAASLTDEQRALIPAGMDPEAEHEQLQRLTRIFKQPDGVMASRQGSQASQSALTPPPNDDEIKEAKRRGMEPDAYAKAARAAKERYKR